MEGHFEFRRDKKEESPVPEMKESFEKLHPRWKEIWSSLIDSGDESARAHVAEINSQLLTEDDYVAAERVFSGEWSETSRELDGYMQSILDFEKKRMQDSGVDPQVTTRRHFSTMLRHYAINRAVEKKLKDRERM